MSIKGVFTTNQGQPIRISYSYQVYLNEFDKTSLAKELPFLVGFIPRGVSGVAEVFDLRYAELDSMVLCCIEDKDGEIETEKLPAHEVVKRIVGELYQYFDHDTIYSGIVDGVELVVFSEVYEGEWDEEWQQFGQDFYKFYIILKHPYSLQRRDLYESKIHNQY